MHRFNSNRLRVCAVLTLMFAVLAAGCEREPRVLASDTIEQRYGLTGVYDDRIASQDGAVDATIVPITLSDGRMAQLVIPRNRQGTLYLRDGEGLTPVVLEQPRVSREEFVRSQPRIVERRVVETEPAATEKKRSWQKEVLIVGGSAGAGAAIGAVAGGKKGAAIGALSGGVAGLVYDLATRNK